MIKKAHPILPVYRVSSGSDGLLYVPPGKFTALASEEADKMEQAWKHGTLRIRLPASLERKKAWCEENANRLLVAWRASAEEAFSPSCLTVFLSNHCNCRCAYCFSESLSPRNLDGTGIVPVISYEAVDAAIGLVAESCGNKKTPFFLVFHGGGEPTIHWDLLTRIFESASRISSKKSLDFRCHIATNGIMTKEQARWLARNIVHIGLSCDGPPHIQDCHRILLNGSPTSKIVEQTASVIKENGGVLEVRSTITPDSVPRQSEIVEYLCSTLYADEIRFEPGYAMGSSDVFFTERHAGPFVKHFLSAQRIASTHGRPLSFSGVRIEEIHGPFCDTARNVLHLLPDGTVSSCFFRLPGGEDNGAPFVVGRYDRQSDSICLDINRIKGMRSRAFEIPLRCRDCINAYHCSRGCPELCMADYYSDISLSTRKKIDFRCRIHQQLTNAWLDSVLLEHRRNYQETALKDTVSGDANNPLDPGPLRYPIESRSLPEPIWSRFGFSSTGVDAWDEIKKRIRQSTPSTPISLYLHIPYCKRRCGFCDCLSKPKGKESENPFVEALIAEISLWGALAPLDQCPVTTVHFGGGSPTCLSFQSLKRIVEALEKHFSLSHSTELALESTSTELSPANLRRLSSLGFSRIHIGVQSFDDAVRARIGRRSAADQAMAAINSSLDLGMVTSIDLVYGLPGQSPFSFMDSVKKAFIAKVHGVSLYRFNQSVRNKNFIKRYSDLFPDAKSDFDSFLAADDFLVKKGYCKNHFVHYALNNDLNLYYTHPYRGENLISMGPTSDGVLNRYHYRHCDFDGYMAFDFSKSPALCGGIEAPIHLEKIERIGAELMCSRTERNGYESRGLGNIFDCWIQDGLIANSGFGEVYSLTGKGSWFINNMMIELEKSYLKQSGSS